MNLRIRSYRERSKMTQQELAKKLGKSFRTVQSWERGESYPNAAMIWKLCEVFDTDPNDFLGWYDARPREKPVGLTDDESEIVGCFRTATPQWRANIAMTARAAAGESKKESERPAREAEDLNEAM